MPATQRCRKPKVMKPRILSGYAVKPGSDGKIAGTGVQQDVFEKSSVHSFAERVTL
jgi:hypothetical protein